MKTTTTEKPHYVYKITNNNPTDSRKYYIGVRTAKDCAPEEDTKYWSSSKHLKEAIKEIGINHFTKEILSIWETREEAEREETNIQRNLNIIHNEEYYNLSIGNAFDGQCNVGMVYCVIKDTNERVAITVDEYRKNKSKYNHHQMNNYNALNTITNKYEKVSIDEFIKREELVSDHKDMIVAKHLETKTIKLIHKSDFNADYVGVAHNKVTVKDEFGNTKSISLEEFNANNNYYGVTKNTISVENKITGIVKRFPRDEIDFNLWTTKLTKMARGSRVNTAIKVEIFDNNDKLQFIAHGCFIKTCKDNNLPINALRKSYKKNGVPIFTSITNGKIKTKLIDSGFYKFKGWYAIKVS